MNEMMIIPFLSFVVAAGGVGVAFWGTKNKAKVDTVTDLRNEVKTLKEEMQKQKEAHAKDLTDMKDKLTLCEVARENLTRDRLALLEQIAFGNPKQYAQNKLDEENGTITSPKVEVKAVE